MDQERAAFLVRRLVSQGATTARLDAVRGLVVATPSPPPLPPLTRRYANATAAAAAAAAATASSSAGAAAAVWVPSLIIDGLARRLQKVRRGCSVAPMVSNRHHVPWLLRWIIIVFEVRRG